MEGALISAMRTAVVQALAARYLARPDSESVGLVGAGRIGALTLWAHIQVVSRISSTIVLMIKVPRRLKLLSSIWRRWA